MQKTPPVKLHKTAALFSKFCSDMEILPSYTPIFLVDMSGRIIYKQRLITSKEDFESIYSLVHDEEIVFMQERGLARDAYAVRGRVDDGKNFIVVSKDSDGFSRCVVCSYSEDKCIRLHDYIEKLCSYKDYLDAFSDLAFSSMARVPVKRLFRMKISGALELVNLASGNARADERRISFPLSLALEKLGAFAGRTNCGSVSFINDDTFSETAVSAPESFFRLVVSAMALVIRHSTNAMVNVFVSKLSDTDNMRVTFVAKSRGNIQDIYERELVSAFRYRGLDCGISDNGKEYSLFVDLPVEKRKPLVVSDVAEISARLDSVMDEQTLIDMYYTILDI